MTVFVTHKRPPVPFDVTLDTFVELGLIERNAADRLLQYHKEAVDHAVNDGRKALYASIRHATQVVFEREVE